MEIKNMTPHEIRIRRGDGTEVVVPPSGAIARVRTTPGARIDTLDGVPVFGAPTWGEVEGLPAPCGATVYLVSSLVAARCAHRHDVVAPGTGPQDGAVRDAGGRVVAVTRLIAAAAETPDHCVYCRADNGPVGLAGRGIARNGYDCCHCGGN